MSHSRTLVGWSSSSFLLLGLVLSAGIARGADEDWPQWRGPARTGISTETGWVAEGAEAPLWAKNVGLGYSSFSVADDKLFTIGWDEEKGQDVVWCLDAKTGEEVWTHRFACKIWNQFHGGGSLTTPSVDGERVFVTNREGRFLCLETKTGKVRWEKDLAESEGVKPPTWGFAGSPLVLDDKVVVNMGKVFAFDKKTGKELWKTNDLGAAYSTPSDFTFKGTPCLAVFNGTGITVIEQKGGKERLNQPWKTRYDVNAATPVVIDGTRIFISSGYNRGCAMVSIDGSEPEVQWESREMRNHMSGCVLYEGHLYGFDEAVFKCLDLDGNLKWEQRGLGKSAFMIADGKLVLNTSKGELVIADATPEGFRELSRQKVLEGRGVLWTSPVIVGGIIYCRDSKGELVARDHRPRN
ncbi:MAG: PQQ-like beta-propeller repeat protein [Planctomycetes bacterium]|nr:PQQ-like beta-propeller repeat protein [Planctomycetota bacterium]